MTPYSVLVANAARREFKRLPSTVVQRMAVVIRGLREQPRPHGCRKLEDEDDMYRIRVGDYRIIYEIDDANHTVLITRARHRREAYD